MLSFQFQISNWLRLLRSWQFGRPDAWLPRQWHVKWAVLLLYRSTPTVSSWSCKQFVHYLIIPHWMFKELFIRCSSIAIDLFEFIPSTWYHCLELQSRKPHKPCILLPCIVDGIWHHHKDSWRFALPRRLVCMMRRKCRIPQTDQIQPRWHLQAIFHK